MIERRPQIPADYGIATGADGMLPWDDVAATLAAAPIYWVATSSADGSPHLIPIWGAWVDDAAYIEGGDSTRWARNLAARPEVQIGVDHEGRQAMVRGVAMSIEVDAAVQQAIAAVYATKYPYQPQGVTFTCITPHRVLAWDTNTLDSFRTTPTEFVFEEAG